MIVLLKLILAHLLGDFLLQPKSWVKEKEVKKAASPKLYFHVLIHGITMLLLFWNINYWQSVLLIMAGHFLTDLSKLYFQKENTRLKWFIADQLIHLLIIITVWYWWMQPEISPELVQMFNRFWPHITALYFLTVPASIAIKIILQKWTEIPDSKDESLKNAGEYIGMMERWFVFIFIATGHWEGVGFLIAAKSVFRFGDLKESKNRKLTEYVLIGTLLSFGIAMLLALAVLQVINLL